MTRLSFIVPCFNVERYVETCISSILACGLAPDDYEIICVNDCSQDSTPDILFRIASNFPQLRVLDLTHNVGFGGVRNLAIKASKGKYVWFVDSDDLVESSNVSELLQIIEEKDLDVLAFNFDRINENNQKMSECRVFPDSMIYDGISFVKNVLGKMLYQNIGYVWRFIYKLDYLKDKRLYFPEGICWEDTVFTPKSMIEAHRIMSSSLISYHYYLHQSSICRQMEKHYPGGLIFDYVFFAGAGLLRYANTINDKELSLGLSNFALKTYLRNNIVLYLLRTTKKERDKFFQLVDKNRDIVRQVENNISGIGRCFLIPFIGPVLAEVFSFLYKKKQ